MDAAGLYLDQPEKETTDEPKSIPTITESTSTDKDLKNMNVEELHTLLQQVLDQEDYVRAIHIRDEINSRKSK
jgi:protein-arginine kinase activator protein McsA